MTHVDVARWVREHLEQVILLLLAVLGGLVKAIGLPHLLPLGLYRLWIVLLGHVEICLQGRCV